MRFYTDGLNLLKANKTAIMAKLPPQSGGTASVQITRVSQTWTFGAFPGISIVTLTGGFDQFKTQLTTTHEEIRSLLVLIEKTQATEDTAGPDAAARESAIMMQLGAAAEAYDELFASASITR